DKRALFTAAVELKCDQMRGQFSIDHETKPAISDQLTAIGHAMNAFLSRPEMLQFDRRIAAETESNPDIGLAFLKAGPWRMRNDFSAFLAHAAEHGQLSIEDTDLAAEQFVSLCKGIGDLERRFGKHLSKERDDKRVASAVRLFLKAYGTI
ncbi:MAG: TetR/AcrR family transcriptional regulator C-terminal domain-containing protein, partial [Pseudomonadota bacterium]